MKKVWIITADQLSFKFCGYTGLVPWIKTPNIDRLAAMGTVFTNAYCSSPLCIPSRHSFYTGLNTRKHRCICDFRILRTKTIFDHLTDAGMRSYGIGKMDFRNDHNQLHGFTERPNAENGAQDFYTTTNNFSSFIGHTVTTIERETDEQCEVITGTTLDCLRRRDASVVYTSYVKPHESWDGVMWYDAPRKFWDLYWAREFPDRKLAGYAANVSLFDYHIGKLIDTAMAENLLEDTLVIFASDHGEMAGENLHWGKHCMWEGAIRVPLITFYPGMQPRKDDSLVGLIDIAPTVFDWLGLIPPDFDGFSLLPKHKYPNRHLFIEVFYGLMKDGIFTDWHGNAHSDQQSTYPHLKRCIRQGNWKLVHDGVHYRLMDLLAVDEMTSVADVRNDIYHSMIDMMENNYPASEIIAERDLKAMPKG